jgi:hypothetical protein
MRQRLPKRDLRGTHRRKIVAARRTGLNAACSCGESRPEALIPGSAPMMCAACQRIANGQTTVDQHHFAGRANSPATMPIAVNDHRARLSVAQGDWPKSTITNPDGSPLLAAAACIRGFIDTVFYLIEEGLLWIADMLEKLDALQVKRVGPRWWLGTDLQQFAPKKKSNGRRS